MMISQIFPDYVRCLAQFFLESVISFRSLSACFTPSTSWLTLNSCSSRGFQECAGEWYNIIIFHDSSFLIQRKSSLCFSSATFFAIILHRNAVYGHIDQINPISLETIKNIVNFVTWVNKEQTCRGFLKQMECDGLVPPAWPRLHFLVQLVWSAAPTQKQWTGISFWLGSRKYVMGMKSKLLLGKAKMIGILIASIKTGLNGFPKSSHTKPIIIKSRQVTLKNKGSR